MSLIPEYVLDEIEDLTRLSTAESICGIDDHRFHHGLTFLSLARYAEVLEAGEIRPDGSVRCTGWAKSKNRRCINYGHPEQHRGTRGFAHVTGCCQHRGVWLDASSIGTWTCEHHR